MTRAVGRTLVIEPEDDRKCSVCGEVAETRPYGPGGADICYPCAMSTPELARTAEEQFNQRFGHTTVAVRDGEVIDMIAGRLVLPGKPEGAPS